MLLGIPGAPLGAGMGVGTQGEQNPGYPEQGASKGLLARPFPCHMPVEFGPGSVCAHMCLCVCPCDSWEEVFIAAHMAAPRC